jgi:hypothetical protein
VGILAGVGILALHSGTFLDARGAAGFLGQQQGNAELFCDFGVYQPVLAQLPDLPDDGIRADGLGARGAAAAPIPSLRETMVGAPGVSDGLFELGGSKTETGADLNVGQPLVQKFRDGRGDRRCPVAGGFRRRYVDGCDYGCSLRMSGAVF